MARAAFIMDVRSCIKWGCMANRFIPLIMGFRM